jgi:hypothetical protein
MEEKRERGNTVTSRPSQLKTSSLEESVLLTGQIDFSGEGAWNYRLTYYLNLQADHAGSGTGILHFNSSSRPVRYK